MSGVVFLMNNSSLVIILLFSKFRPDSYQDQNIKFVSHNTQLISAKLSYKESITTYIYKIICDHNVSVFAVV